MKEPQEVPLYVMHVSTVREGRGLQCPCRAPFSELHLEGTCLIRAPARRQQSLEKRSAQAYFTTECSPVEQSPVSVFQWLRHPSSVCQSSSVSYQKKVTWFGINTVELALDNYFRSFICIVAPTQCSIIPCHIHPGPKLTFPNLCQNVNKWQYVPLFSTVSLFAF